MSHIASRSLNLVEESPVPAPPELIEQCFNRVEYYQPLYGVTGVEGPLRSCRDRAVVIEMALDSLGRRLSLVDFGSSLGYFPFFFADRGAQTTGVDINPENTAVALATQRVNGLSATFKTAPLDLTTVSAISPGEYDVALALSVLHHITLRRGMDYVTQLVAELIARIPTLIVELAHRDEDVNFAWRASLPVDPLEIFSACLDIQIQHLGNFSSHLSSSVRPMYLIKR
ncbi:methyltransferase domain protein [Paraburkholderia xenovorans LB400]|uniref:class I SAM-dependent methyltransferase n=1 Tax=Paraburkholderia xenovorans TaxID=36873 RepID=UPI00032225EA|nr:methyltransferase domain-containing protein [Paraburkholderia xenovorans]AIP35767.1 methyltransferase domain protein [Paraburkholderia xenovorans LB400]